MRGVRFPPGQLGTRVRRRILEQRVVRGIDFAWLANFVAGNSKARPVVAERMAALLDDPLPCRSTGRYGAGEVLPMADVV